MTEPDKRAMETDLTGTSFLSGVANGWWDHVEDSAPDWPTMIFWVAAAKRDKAPDRFYLKLNCKNYPTDSPTGTFWDPETKEQLAGRKWPKGSGQVSAVFNPTWENGVASITRWIDFLWEVTRQDRMIGASNTHSMCGKVTGT